MKIALFFGIIVRGEIFSEHGFKQRTAEYRMSNRRISKGGIASLSFFIKKDRAKRYHKSSIFNRQSSIPDCPG